jgi:DedD protein
LSDDLNWDDKKMKFALDERLKHRLTGLVVILSIGVIFLPAMLKKSNQHLEEKVSFSVRLPEKPAAPEVLVTKEKEVFQAVKVAKVDIPPLIQKKSIQLVRAEPISLKSAMPAVIALNKTLAKVEMDAIVRPAVKTASAPRKIAVAAVTGLKKEVYAVQLASFSEQSNAESLVTRLRNKGYKATYNKAGAYYKVMVGQSERRQEAVNLQKKLSTNMSLNGFIIKKSDS